MKLSKRLKTIADMVTPHLIVADIGTDHGYVPIYLLCENIIPRALAMDISVDCLIKAKINAKRADVFNLMDFRLSDGLDEFDAGDAEALIIAGMGGNMISDILRRAAKDRKLKGIREIIVSPHRDISLVRQTIYETGFVITDENVVEDSGKYYFCIKAEPRGINLESNELLSPIFLKYGKILLERKDETLEAFLENERKVYRDILSGKIEGKDRRKIEAELSVIEEALSFY